jgi:hypothetical protein
MSSAIDLRILYPRYLYKYEDSWPDEEFIEEEEIYFVEMVCKFGVISLHTEDTLYARYDGVNISIKKKLKEIPDSVILETDVETICYIPIKWARRLFRVLKPKLNNDESSKVRQRLLGNK